MILLVLFLLMSWCSKFGGVFEGGVNGINVLMCIIVVDDLEYRKNMFCGFNCWVVWFMGYFFVGGIFRLFSVVR